MTESLIQFASTTILLVTLWVWLFEINSRKLLQSLAGLALGLLFCWLCGYDFDHRGLAAVLTLLVCVFCMGVGYELKTKKRK